MYNKRNKRKYKLLKSRQIIRSLIFLLEIRTGHSKNLLFFNALLKRRKNQRNSLWFRKQKLNLKFVCLERFKFHQSQNCTSHSKKKSPQKFYLQLKRRKLWTNPRHQRSRHQTWLKNFKRKRKSMPLWPSSGWCCASGCYLWSFIELNSITIPHHSFTYWKIIFIVPIVRGIFMWILIEIEYLYQNFKVIFRLEFPAVFSAWRVPTLVC